MYPTLESYLEIDATPEITYDAVEAQKAFAQSIANAEAIAGLVLFFAGILIAGMVAMSAIFYFRVLKKEPFLALQFVALFVGFLALSAVFPFVTEGADAYTDPSLDHLVADTDLSVTRLLGHSKSAIAVLLISLVAFRQRLRFYAVAVLGFSVLAAAYTGQISTFLILAVSMAVGLGMINYLIMLLIEHGKEVPLLPGRKHILSTIIRSSYLATLPIIFVGAGIYVHDSISNAVKEAVYSTYLFQQHEVTDGNDPNGFFRDNEGRIYNDTIRRWKAIASEDGDDELDKSDLESDLILLVEHNGVEQKQQIRSEFDERLGSVVDGTDRNAGEAIDFLNEIDPPAFNEHRLCQNFKLRVKLVGTISMRGMCRGLVLGIEAEIQSAHRRSIEQTSTYIRGMAEEANLTASEYDERVFNASLSVVDDHVSAQKRVIRGLFLAAEIIELIGRFALVAALLGTVAVVTSRAAFHKRNIGEQEKDGAGGAAFSLERSELRTVEPEPAKAISWKSDSRIELPFRKRGRQGGFSAALRAKLPDVLAQLVPDRKESLRSNTWYFLPSKTIKISAVNHGERLGAPHFMTGMLQRLIKRKFWFTKLEVKAPKSASISANHARKVVSISLKKGQRIVFRLDNLVGFNQSVRLSRGYTTHAGSYFLGIGPFYWIAELKEDETVGSVMLISTGEELQSSTVSSSELPSSIIAWDSKAEFGLVQNLSQAGVWLNRPSLLCGPEEKVALCDHIKDQEVSMLGRFWAVFRYLVMPI